MAATTSPAARVSIVTTATGNKRDRGAHAGFTLIEMLAVIVLIAIAATVAAVTLHGRGQGQLEATAQRMAAGLRDTRTRAMATGKPQWFGVDLRAHAFAAPGRDPHELPEDVQVKVVSAAEDVQRAGDARIRFFPDGSSSGGNITLSRARQTARIDVDWLTGAVTLRAGNAVGEGDAGGGS